MEWIENYLLATVRYNTAITIIGLAQGLNVARTVAKKIIIDGVKAQVLVKRGTGWWYHPLFKDWFLNQQNQLMDEKVKEIKEIPVLKKEKVNELGKALLKELEDK